MKKALNITKKELYYYKDGKKIFGTHDKISGNVSGIYGNIDECEITEEDRKKGINIKDLITEKE